MKKILKIIVVVLVVILILVALVSLLAGPMAKSYVNRNGETLVGRQAHVEHVGVNLFSGNVNIRRLTVYEDDAVDTFACFDTLDVSLRLLKLLGREVYVKHITLAGLDVQVLQRDTVFNFSSMLKHFGSDEPEGELDTTPSSWVVNLHNIRLSHGRVYYADLVRGSHWGLNDMNLVVPDFCIGGSDNTDAGLTVALADGGQLTAQGEYNARSNDFSATLRLEHFALDQVRPYVSDRAKVGEIRGRLGLDAEVKGNLSEVMDMVIGGKATVEDVDVLDEREMSIATLGRLCVELNRVVPGKGVYDIAKVELEGLSARYEVFGDSSNTLTRLLVADESIDSSQSKEESGESVASEALKLHIGHVALNDINITYADHSLPDDFEFAVTKMRVSADELTTSGSSSAKLFANLPHGGVAMINWSGSIDDWKSYQSLRLNIKNLHLTDLSPYLVAHLGQPFTDGIFSFTSYNTVRNSQLDGMNRIDIYKPEVGDRRKDVKDAKKLPLKAALYVLKDKEGKVLLDVPVKGNVDSPEFNYMKLVWKTLGNLLVKVATSPFRALAGGGDGEELFISVSPEESNFTSEQFYSIDRVAQMAKMDENIVLHLELQTQPTDDSVIVRNHERRNKILLRHLTQEGIPEGQVVMSQAPPSAEIKREGYVVSTTLKEMPEMEGEEVEE